MMWLSSTRLHLRSPEEATKNAIKGYREINMKGLKAGQRWWLSGHLLLLSLYDAGTAGKNGKGSGQRLAHKTNPPGGVPHSGTGSPDSVGKLFQCAGSHIILSSLSSRLLRKNSILMQIHDPAQTVPYYIESVRLSDKTYQGLPDNRY